MRTRLPVVRALSVFTVTLITLTLAHPSVGSDLDPQLKEEIDALVSESSRKDAPGGVVAVLSKGNSLYTKSFGLANIDAKQPITEETPFYLASLAKPFTAACVVHAAQAGKINLDDSVTQHFAELPDGFAAATMRHLIHHTSGIPDVYDLAIAANLDPAVLASNAEAIQVLSNVPGPPFPPGQRFLYSNSGYLLLAELLKRASGSDLAEYARTHFFRPLKMKDSRYSSGDERDKRAAVAYGKADKGWKPLELKTGLCGPGGMYASMADLTRFEQAWRANRFGGSKLRAELLNPPECIHNPKIGPYAAGWMLQKYRGLRVERHFGGAFGFGSDLMRFPEHKITIVTLTNCEQISATDLTESIADVVLRRAISKSNQESPTTAPLTREEVGRFGRLWQDPATGAMWVVTPKPDGFVLAALGDIKLRLSATSSTRLEATDSHIPFAVELHDKQLWLRQAEETIAKLNPLPFPPRSLGALDDYVGAYENKALGASVRFTPSQGRFLLLEQTRPILKLPPFIPIGSDYFFCDRGARARFVRDESGRVTGVTIDANRAWGLEFSKASVE